MQLIYLYYQLKPILPRPLQIALRRVIASCKRRIDKEVWPINLIAAKKPEGWVGWPDRKMFALVLVHDVDSVNGLKKCVKLMNLEKQLCFRASFNFVPEDYPTPLPLIQSFAESGFEVGVHGLKHDGKLFISPKEFRLKVPRINHYLKKWGAAGFTAPSMLGKRNLIGELDIEYACSSYDTDPFKPSSESVNSLFPFFAGNDTKTRTYVEIPYTLAQDHGLFVILREKDIGIWKQKVDWIAGNGGMAGLISPPDYMKFDGAPYKNDEYPVSHYIDILDYLRRKYAGQYWH